MPRSQPILPPATERELMPQGPTRYQVKPLLRLLECYVMWAIGELSESDAKIMTDMTPKLQSVYGTKGTWQDAIEKAVKLPTNMPDMIRAMWTKNSEIARAKNLKLSPQQFAEMFVNQNLV